LNPKAAVEAALFSAAGNLRISEIAEKTGISEEEVRTALVDLRRDYDVRESAIMIAKIGGEYRMMLRAEYSECTGTFAKAEMTPGMMRTLSTIAYNQPVLQSELLKTRGPRTYDDVHALVDMGFVSAKKSGQTKELTTTKKFSEHFGIGSTRKDDIRRWIESQSRIKPGPEPSDESQDGPA
jgi:segregation and condensation protein B